MYSITPQAWSYLSNIFWILVFPLHSLLQNLFDNTWVDKYTRAIFVEFTVYNANVNLFCIVTLMFETTAVGESRVLARFHWHPRGSWVISFWLPRSVPVSQWSTKCPPLSVNWWFSYFHDGLWGHVFSLHFLLHVSAGQSYPMKNANNYAWFKTDSDTMNPPPLPKTGPPYKTAKVGIFQEQVESFGTSHHYFKLECHVRFYQEETVGQQGYWVLSKS